jgi:hypothetical protein
LIRSVLTGKAKESILPWTAANCGDASRW